MVRDRYWQDHRTEQAEQPSAQQDEIDEASFGSYIIHLKQKANLWMYQLKEGFGPYYKQ